MKVSAADVNALMLSQAYSSAPLIVIGLLSGVVTVKIALVTYKLCTAGTERVSWNIAQGLCNAGYDPVLIRCTSTGEMDAHFRASHGDSLETVALSDTNWGSRTWGQVRTFLAYRRWLKENRPDVVMATGNNISWFTALGCLSLLSVHIPYFIKTTNPIIRHQDGWLENLVRRIIYALIFRNSRGVLTLSRTEAQLLQKQFPAAAEKFQPVYNAYLTDDFAADARAARSGDAPLVILGVGRFVDQKNFPRLLRAFAAAASGNAILRLAGDGEKRGELVALAEKLGIADRVEFLGFVNNVPELMASADLFVLSSDYEGLPAVVVEALASNLPVIATDCFATAREMLDDLPGCSVIEKSDEALADALRAWVSNPVRAPVLRPRALNYSTASSVDSHMSAIQTTLGIAVPAPVLLNAA
jgi:glycosyltransferase involved in cell wall biosynthesis